MAEDESPISECPPNQRSGLRLAPPFFVPCGCWDDMIIPIGLVTNTLRAFLNKGLKEGAEKVLGKTLLKSRLAKLVTKKTSANTAIKFIEQKGEKIYNRIMKLRNDWKIAYEAELKKVDQLLKLDIYRNSLNNSLKFYRSEILRIQKEHPIWVAKIQELAQKFPGETYYPGWYLSTSNYFAKYGVPKPDYHTLRSKAFPQYYLYINWAASAKQDIANFRKSIDDALKIITEKNAEASLLKEGIKAHKTDQAIAIAKLEKTRESFSIGPGRTVPAGTYEDQLEYLHGQMKELEDHISMIQELENRADVVVDNKIEQLNKEIDLTFPDIALSIGEIIVDILSTLSIVGPHICREGENGVILNAETCKCDTCPPDKALCQPISFDPGIRLPWTALADSANYCLDPCCGGQVDETGSPLRVYEPSTYLFSGGIGELLGVDQCACGCPGDLVKKPCVNSICNDNFTCENDFFPDDGCTSLRLFSKFYWNDGSNGKDCGYRCSDELSDADCFAFYGQYTKWSSRKDIQYCNCVCQDKSETDCPEKATYSMMDSYHLPEDFTGTYCDVLENPIQPVCTCVCDRPDDCPEGQVLNRSIFGPNACECVPEYGEYPYGNLTYQFDTKTQSWTIS